MIDDLLIFEAALRTARALAMITGGLVAFDAIGILTGQSERPPHNPRANAVAWLIAGTTALLVAGWALWRGYGLVGPDMPIARQWIHALLWLGLAAAFTIRAAARAFRPVMIYVVAAGLGATMMGFALVDALLP